MSEPPVPVPTTMAGRWRDLGYRISTYGRRTALLGGGVVLLATLTAWQMDRWHHVTETDARVMADMITISSRIDGWVAERRVTDGDPVTTGRELVVIDQRSAEAQLSELLAKAASLQLDRARTQTQLHMTETTAPAAVDAARARREAAEANRRAADSELERARRDYRRTDALAAQQFSSREAWDQRRNQLEQAQDHQQAAQAQLSEAGATLADAEARLGEIDSLRQQQERLGHDLEQVEAQIRRQRIALSDCILRSPVDGRVDQKFVEPGEYVIPGQRLLLLHDPRSLWIEANIKETKLAGLRPGQPATITVDAFPDLHLTGRVERIGHATTSQFALLPSPNPSGNFTKIAQRVPVRIAVDPTQGEHLRPGLMVEVDIDTAHP